MSTLYRHQQFSRPVAVSGVVMSAVFCLGGAWLYFSTRQPLILWISLAALALVVTAHYLLSSLTVELCAQELRWHFGPGIWRKRIALAEVAAVRRIRLPWWYGIGVKYMPRAVAYLVAPGEGIEIATTTGQIVRIGSDDAERLAAALTRAPLPQA